jgi:hypothetical protein
MHGILLFIDLQGVDGWERLQRFVYSKLAPILKGQNNR